MPRCRRVRGASEVAGSTGKRSSSAPVLGEPRPCETRHPGDAARGAVSRDRVPRRQRGPWDQKEQTQWRHSYLWHKASCVPPETGPDMQTVLLDSD
ncbi:hypothetical protein AAFF_G00291750 [Aldrovandia affinis]|uniref:Uncharacterized protein n=1 Tax=Aldrovandia affinis TaxID=143900 RepID=A0AAD7SQ75_9TELE|nr:hypothetical protein AAFF_G00291750 [Aldrovandia affinis]